MHVGLHEAIHGVGHKPSTINTDTQTAAYHIVVTNIL